MALGKGDEESRGRARSVDGKARSAARSSNPRSAMKQRKVGGRSARSRVDENKNVAIRSTKLGPKKAQEEKKEDKSRGRSRNSGKSVKNEGNRSNSRGK